MAQPILSFWGLPGGLEWIVILIVGLLVFGGRLPSVARSIGQSIVEFKRGLHDVKGELESEESGGNKNRILPEKPTSTEKAGAGAESHSVEHETSSRSDTD